MLLTCFTVKFGLDSDTIHVDVEGDVQVLGVKHELVEPVLLHTNVLDFRWLAAGTRLCIHTSPFPTKSTFTTPSLSTPADHGILRSGGLSHDSNPFDRRGIDAPPHA